jgi:hypothetical protein
MEKEKNGSYLRPFRALFLLCSLFLLSFGSFRHDAYLEAIIIVNLYLKFAKDATLRLLLITPYEKRSY